VSAAAVQLATKRTQEIRYKKWSPPQSSITVEYSDNLLREVRLAGLLGDASGVLYGIRDGQWIRVAAARRTVNEGGFQGDARLAGLEPVGIFSARVRGEIFLTESDLKHFEQSEGTIALVVAGSKAGFFLYEADGSIETIKSHAEFRLSGEESGAKPALPTCVEPRFEIDAPRLSSWVWMVPVAVLAMVALVATQSFWLPRPPLLLTAHDQEGQVRIAWNRAATTGMGAELEIADGDAHISVPLSPDFASAVYVRHTSDVQIHLTAGGHTETLRFFGADTPLTPVGAARQRVTDLESEAQTLDAALERGMRQIGRLQAEIDSLVNAPR
jgi:hypothetical protein